MIKYKIIFWATLFLLFACNKKQDVKEEPHQNSSSSLDQSHDTIPFFEEYPCGEREPIELGKTKYITVSNAFMNPIPIKKANAVLLISNESELRKHESLFFNNEAPIIHLCGHHYELNFWDSNFHLIHQKKHNTECEYYCFDAALINSMVESHAKQLATQPTHYAYEVWVSGGEEITEVISKLTQKGFLIFYNDLSLFVTTQHPSNSSKLFIHSTFSLKYFDAYLRISLIISIFGV